MSDWCGFLFPYSIWQCLWLAPVAICADLIFGDPPLPWPHPVCLIGQLLNVQEKIIRKTSTHIQYKKFKSYFEKLAGLFSLIISLLIVGAASLFLIHLPIIGFFFAVYLAYAGLAMGCLLHTGACVNRRIESGDIYSAREGVSWLVSRDTSAMDRNLLRKTLADSLSENYTDAFLAPFIFLLIGGPAALWLYKTISTMDSQWGYLTKKWRNIGWAGAKADDCAAFIPARLSAIIFYMTDLFFKILNINKLWKGQWPGLMKIRADAKGMPSPNSGWSMASCAWLIPGKMAGPSIYFGELVHKAVLGPPNMKNWTEIQLLALRQLLLYATLIGGLICWTLCACLQFIF